uniref:Protein Flattop n=2 Tax=Nothobranchius pienaari TaxID=704102 RepID=A0A1A8L401_9TELE
MSCTFSANQYESAFRAQRMQNRCETKCSKRPGARVGHTSFIADSKGHLLPGVKRGRVLPDYKGTWDLPARIPVHPINPTARSMEGLRRLQVWGLCPEQGTKLHAGTRSTDAGEQTSVGVRPGAADSTVRADAQPASQSHNSPLAASSGHDSQAAANERPLSQSSAKLQNPAATETREGRSFLCCCMSTESFTIKASASI